MYSPIPWECKLSIPICFFSRTMEGKMESWVEKGTISIGDITDTKGHTLSLTDIKDNFNVSCDFLSYIEMKKKVEQVLGTGTRYEPKKQFPQLPYV